MKEQHKFLLFLLLSKKGLNFYGPTNEGRSINRSMISCYVYINVQTKHLVSKPLQGERKFGRMEGKNKSGWGRRYIVTQLCTSVKILVQILPVSTRIISYIFPKSSQHKNNITYVRKIFIDNEMQLLLLIAK